MDIVTEWRQDAENGAPCAIALGYFDGVHLGHRAVLEKARQYAARHGLRFAVFTFAQVAGKAAAQQSPKGASIYPADIKHSLLAEAGVETCYEPPFESFCSLAPQAFFTGMLLEAFRAKAVFCGEDFAFGAKRAGNTAVLRRLCKEANVHLEVAPLLEWEGQPVSSSRIRQALEAGDMPLANAMLGALYQTDYPVLHGRNLGTTLGMPTINQVFPPGLQPPAFGVYVTQTLVDGQAWPSATGYGRRPTVDGVGEPTCETFIPGYSGDLYGKKVKVLFYEKIDDPQKFASAEELGEAVKAWARQAMAYFEFL